MKNKFPLSRRRLLQQLGFSAAALSSGLAPYALGAAPPRKLGIALVGLGGYSTNQLAPALQLTQHCELRGIVTGSPEKIPKWQDKYGIKDANVYSYENMHTLADNPDIDVIYVVTPPSLHKEYSVISANAGKHVWCEKPMAMDEQECQDIIDACNTSPTPKPLWNSPAPAPTAPSSALIPWLPTAGAEVARQMIGACAEIWAAAPCTIWAFTP